MECGWPKEWKKSWYLYRRISKTKYRACLIVVWAVLLVVGIVVVVVVVEDVGAVVAVGGGVGR